MTNRADKYNLNRFLEAQNVVYPIVLKELTEGHKRTHWMWYIFPQIKGLGYSYNSEFYGISSLEEATAYLSDPILDQRLRETTTILQNISGNDIISILGPIDALKLHSSMTLFDKASPNDIFDQLLTKYFNGKRDENTLKLLEEKLK